MSGYPAQITQAQFDLSQLEAKIEEIEGLKLMEPKLRAKAAALVAKIAELKENATNDKSEKAFHAKEGEEEEEEALPPPKQAPAKPRITAEEKKKALLRAINKKLKQIELLKTKENLDADAKAKLASEPKLLKQRAAVEAGEQWVDSDADEEDEAPAKTTNGAKNADEDDDDDDNTASTIKLPTDPAEKDKRMKNLKKKLQQIAKLKEKGGDHDKEAQEKIASENRINQEIAALEAGKQELTFVERTLEDEKFDLEKKLKNVTKKLEQIKKLKDGGNLDADAQAKVDAESSLNKEANALRKQIGDINKKERDRVAERLGWESDVKDLKKDQKQQDHNAKKNKAKK